MSRILRNPSRAACLVLLCVASVTHAQHKPPLPGNYPNKPVRMLVATSPGSGTDIIARYMAQRLTERLGQQVIVDNRPGAGGAIAWEILSHATPDGYTISVQSVSGMTAWMTQRKALFNVRAFTPVVHLNSQPYLVVVNPSLPVNSIKELIAHAKSKPGALNYGSAGIGSTAHLGMEPGSSLGILDLMAGRIEVQINNIIAASRLVKQGRLKALAVTSLKRVHILPDLPTVSEGGLPGYELNNMYGIMGPARMPPAIVLALNREGSEIMNAPETRNKLAADGSVATAPNSPPEFGDKLTREAAKWGKIILMAGPKI
ncbi:MAG: tripartite tricarboxylate transporter substrate binding protein [Betaproteobacteria bacterium]|nr:tripartite tricarboxylate transporter substrate binding protein [Betaproteobacteria bacterium]